MHNKEALFACRSRQSQTKSESSFSWKSFMLTQKKPRCPVALLSPAERQMLMPFHYYHTPGMRSSAKARWHIVPFRALRWRKAHYFRITRTLPQDALGKVATISFWQVVTTEINVSGWKTDTAVNTCVWSVIESLDVSLINSFQL